MCLLETIFTYWKPFWPVGNHSDILEINFAFWESMFAVEGNFGLLESILPFSLSKPLNMFWPCRRHFILALWNTHLSSLENHFDL